MRKKFILVLCLLAVTAFIARMAVSIELHNYNGGMNSVTAPSPSTDMRTYMSLSELVAQGEYSKPFKYQPFYYAVFLAMLKILFGNSVWIVIVAQSILGAATVYISGLSAAKIWGKNSGVITAGLLAFCSVLIIYTPFHLIVTLQTFWIALLFYACILAIRHRNWKRWTIVGIIYACAILTRGNVWLFFPGLVACSVFCQFSRKSDREKLSVGKILLKLVPMTALIIFTILPQIPFAAYNTQKVGKLTPPSTDAQVVLALGNTPESPPGGRERGMGPGAMEYPKTYSDWTNKDNMKEISIQERIWNWFLNEPAAFIELTFRKLLLFWDHNEIPNNISYYMHGELSKTFLVFGLVESWLLISLGLAGMVCLYRQNHKKLELQLLFYLIIAYWFSVAAFYILSRFRAPILPLLAIYSSFFLCHFWDIRKKSFERAYYFYFPVMFVFFCISFFGYNFYRFHMEADMTNFVRPYGTVIHQKDMDMILDNGPQTFGGWNYVCFQPGTKVTKTFGNIEDKNYRSVEFEVYMLWESPGEATFRINGYKRELTNSKGGPVMEKFILPFPENGKFAIQLLRATTRVFYFVDVQRNYQRTKIGDFIPPGELVCRIYCSRKTFKEFKAIQRKIPIELDPKKRKRRRKYEQDRGMNSQPSSFALLDK